jgi:hypothetical protein
MIANETAAPNSLVIGISGMASPRIEVLAIRLSPYGALTSSLNSGFSPSNTELAAWVNIHSNRTWSW